MIQPAVRSGAQTAPGGSGSPGDDTAARDAARDAAVAELLADYAPKPGVPDEMIGPDGTLRPGWDGLLRSLAALSPAEIGHRVARGAQYLRDAGVFFRRYGAAADATARDAGTRDWPLAPLPVLISATDWEAISAGLTQRADILELLMADLYGDHALVTGGHLPAAVVAQNPEWLRPLQGVTPRSGHFLHFLAFDVGRGPGGNWWVLGDRTQAPSGAGFALENRIATTRVWSDHYAKAGVHRLAGFFRRFRDALFDLRDGAEGHVGILTPGPMNDSYYEHAYIARYLGFMLVEGEDLVVEDGRVMVRTVAGLSPVSVLWRRLDAGFADPLELNSGSRLGTPGMVGAVRDGAVTMINALGSGVLEARVMMAFMPRIAKVLTGSPLLMPNVATWWCGQAAERDYVIAHADRLTLGPALSTRLAFEPEELDPRRRDAGPVAETLPGRGAGGQGEDGSGEDGPGEVGPGEGGQVEGGPGEDGQGEDGQGEGGPGDNLAARVVAAGGQMVGQEAVTLSTTPVLENGRLVPRPMTLRVFLARTPSGWQVMPGGFARVGASDDPRAIALQRGGSVADVWVQTGGRVPGAETMLGPQDGHFQRPRLGALPARAADNLYWMGRYVERAELTLRMLRAWHARLSEAGRADTPVLIDLAALLAARGASPFEPEEDDADAEATRAAPGRTPAPGIEGAAVTPMKAAPPSGIVGSRPVPATVRVPMHGVSDAVLNALSAAMRSAGQVRDRFSPDGWAALSDLAKTARRMDGTVHPGDDAARAMGILLRKLSGFSGLVQDNMYRFTGWRFLSLGRSLERASGMAGLLADLARPDAPEGALDLALDIGDSVMSHRRRYAVASSRATVVDLLALDGMNPRAVQHQLEQIRTHLSFLPGAEPHGPPTPPQRALLLAEAALGCETADTLDPAALLDLQRLLGELSDQITAAYLG